MNNYYTYYNPNPDGISMGSYSEERRKNMGSHHIYYNPNPYGYNVGDCTVRALSRAFDQDWRATYSVLSAVGFDFGDMPSANNVWGEYLRAKKFNKHLVDDHGQKIYTVDDFCSEHPRGLFVLKLPGHVVCVEDGRYYDSWDSGGQIPEYFWTR